MQCAASGVSRQCQRIILVSKRECSKRERNEINDHRENEQYRGVTSYREKRERERRVYAEGVHTRFMCTLIPFRIASYILPLLTLMVLRLLLLGRSALIEHLFEKLELGCYKGWEEEG